MTVATPVPKTVVVLGAAYGGHRAVQYLVTNLPDDWRIVVIERSTHFNHIYAFPRVSVLENIEHKAFVPHTNIFKPPPTFTSPSPCPHVLIHGTVTGMDETTVTYTLLDDDQTTQHSVRFDYLVYSLGSYLPAPINIWAPMGHALDAENGDVVGHPRGTKLEGVDWMKAAQKRVKDVKSVLVVGGGALGVQLATDIASVYGPGSKSITLMHSRAQLLPRFDAWMHEQTMNKLHKLKVDVMLNSRVDMDHLGSAEKGRVRTVDGREVCAELILWCTGQTPNTSFLVSSYPSSVSPKTGLATVNRQLQLSTKTASGDEETVNPRIFVIGDCADAFGALNAGHTAWVQAEVAAENIVKLVNGEEDDLASYEAPLPAIKVSLGLDEAIVQHDGKHEVYGPEHCTEDLNCELVWEMRGLSTDDMYI